jgi:hypothetical protein
MRKDEREAAEAREHQTDEDVINKEQPPDKRWQNCQVRPKIYRPGHSQSGAHQSDVK